MNLLLDSTLKVSVIVLMALGAKLLLRRQSAAVRHWVLAVAIACAVVTPVVGVMAPSWHIGLDTFCPRSADRTIGISRQHDHRSAWRPLPAASLRRRVGC